MIDNPNPIIKLNNILSDDILKKRYKEEYLLNDNTEIDEIEVFDLIKNITDPEHPLTLEQLSVITLDQIKVIKNKIQVKFTPTIPHCSSASLIGLMILTKLKYTNKL